MRQRPHRDLDQPSSITISPGVLSTLVAVGGLAAAAFVAAKTRSDPATIATLVTTLILSGRVKTGELVDLVRSWRTSKSVQNPELPDKME